MSDFSHNPDPVKPVAFCQNCGTSLNSETVRRVGTAVYCEPCLAARLAGSPANPGPHAGPVPPQQPPTSGPNWVYGSAPIPPNYPPSWPGSSPNPGLAALLGLIPGVGAMYNEQYAKGIVHLLVFAVLESFSHVVGIFHLFAFGWICYMSIEAHHTAKARRDGTPLPNPFGFNDIGERMGFGKSWPGAGTSHGVDVAAAARDAMHAAAQGIGAAAAGFQQRHAPQPPQTPPAPQTPTDPSWGGPVNTYPPAQPGNPPTSGFQPTPDLGEAIKQKIARDMGVPYYPYGYTAPNPEQPPTYASTFVPPAQTPYDTAIPPQTPGRFPAGAVWLIGLGMIFLLGTLGIFSAVPGSAIVGVTLLVLGVWIFLRRMLETGSSLEPDGTSAYNLRVLRALRKSIWLIAIGIISLLDSFHIVHWDNQWPWLIILAGIMMLLQRAAHNAAAASYMPPATPTPGPVTPDYREGGL